MRFKVNGFIELPNDVTELLIGCKVVSEEFDDNDCSIDLNQNMLNKLSGVLNLIYSTKQIDEVQSLLDKFCTNLREIKMLELNRNQQQPFTQFVPLPMYQQPVQPIYQQQQQNSMQTGINQPQPKQEPEITFTKVKPTDVVGNSSFSNMGDIKRRAASRIK